MPPNNTLNNSLYDDLDHSPYDALDHYWPVQFESGDARPIGKILVKDSWYAPMKWIYDKCQALLDAGTIVGVSNRPLSEIVMDYMPEMTIHFGVLGIQLFVIRLVIAAARRGIELSKFKLHSGWGPSRIGWTPNGGVLYKEVR